VLNRRHLLAAGSAGALAPLAAPGAVGAQTAVSAPAPGEDTKLRALLDAFFQEQVDDSPQNATSLGLDKGARAHLKHELNDRSAAEKVRATERARSRLARLRAIDRARLGDDAKIDYDVIEYGLAQTVDAGTRFAYGELGARSPFVISQQQGAYQGVPDFLDSAHTIKTPEDCEAYLDRLHAFPRALDQDLERLREDGAKGVLAPNYCLETTVGQIEALRAKSAHDIVLTESIRRRATAAGLDGAGYSAKAEAIVAAEVFPALDRQIAAVKAAQAKATADAGVWRLPKGAEYYAAALKASTTTDLTPDEIHKLGLDQVAEITGRLDGILRAKGLTQGTVAQRLTALGDDPAQLYPETVEGRAALLDSLNGYVKTMYGLLPQAFEHIPQAPLVIRRVPPFIQDGASNGYYNGASLDGSRPAIYYINLKYTHDWPKFGLPTLTWHEGVPGHHLQISTAQESKDIPLIRRRGGYSAYTEGWALYAEQLAGEIGVYKDQPLGEAGFLQSFLFRAARLVVDTGMHHKRWSRDKAVDYLVGATGFPRPRSVREIDRYCVQPGQACSYKVGHTQWVKLRERQRAALGAKFDLKAFHRVLSKGAMPLTILERVVEADTAARLTA
jgi:uncharacterized protein (DUF885 family)